MSENLSGKWEKSDRKKTSKLAHVSFYFLFKMTSSSPYASLISSNWRQKLRYLSLRYLYDIWDGLSFGFLASFLFFVKFLFLYPNRLSCLFFDFSSFLAKPGSFNSFAPLFFSTFTSFFLSFIWLKQPSQQFINYTSSFILQF